MARNKDFDDSRYYEEEGYSNGSKRRKPFKKDKYKKSYLDDLEDYNYYETKKNRKVR
jgi:hypothetical protein